ncbi:hypothetical protein M0412_12925 [Agrobacterium sp. O3.4]|uniref:Uncharacterized protein n=2 Tax=Rhizobium/Agrobacterium group TaxID=227290 RepID=A0A546XGE6_RHIRH|nr:MULTISPECIES: hypothetical protein [Rhizobium/Agrobacterium group]MCZ7468586.1 hypothetical protein [Rhizobium rhizogenes]TRA99835.1 hypothetical protein EXN68_15435 [Rhizobium rhizogenes]WHO10694.1 hypothetical protein KZ699_19565 [Agrobacterium cucumeris]
MAEKKPEPLTVGGTTTSKNNEDRGVRFSEKVRDQLKSIENGKADVSRVTRTTTNSPAAWLVLIAVSLIVLFTVSTVRSSLRSPNHHAPAPVNADALRSRSDIMVPAFRYIVEQDSFTGLNVDFARVENDQGQSLYIGKPDKRRQDFKENTAFVIHPGSYICTIGGDWLVIDFISLRDGLVSQPMQMRWDVSRDKRRLKIEPGTRSDKFLNSIVGADEIRLRYEDDCGHVETLIFDTDGLEGALSKLRAGS